MDRTAMLQHSRHQVDDPADRYGALLLALDTASAVADADPAHADLWDFCTIDLTVAAVLLRPRFGAVVALHPDLPPVQPDADLIAALHDLLVDLARQFRAAAEDTLHDVGLEVAAHLEQVAAALP